MWEFYCEKMGILEMQDECAGRREQKAKIASSSESMGSQVTSPCRTQHKDVYAHMYVLFHVWVCVYIPVYTDMVSRYIHTVQNRKPFKRQRWGSFGSWHKPGFCGGIQRANKISPHWYGRGWGQIIILRHLNMWEEYNNNNIPHYIVYIYCRYFLRFIEH